MNTKAMVLIKYSAKGKLKSNDDKNVFMDTKFLAIK